MKKIALFCSAALLALSFSSCEENPGLGIPQVNPQETIMSAGGITVEYGAAIQANAIDLSEYKDKTIPVIKLALTEEEAAAIPAGSDVKFVMDLATQADYSDAVQLPVTDGAVSCADWDNYFRSKLGKSPAAKDNYVRFAAYLENENQSVRVGSPDTWFAAKKLTVTPIPMDFVISEGYYLVGTANGWALTAGDMPFKHSAANVYDDPIFTLTVNITEQQIADNNGWWWKIASKEAVEAENWDIVIGVKVDGDTSLEGALVDAGNAGCIKEAGTYNMTINMMDMTYKFEKLSFLYTPGVSNGWDQAASQQLAFNANKGYYEGYARLSGEFKFTSAPNWDGTNYGGTGTEGQLTIDGGAGNLTVAQDGLYYCTVDTENLTYTATLVTSYGMIGDFNNWGAQTVMTPSEDFLKWTGDVTLAEGNGWKFRANDDWGINLGGAADNLVLDGSDIKGIAAGTYTVTLDLSKLPYSYTMVKK